MFHIVHTPYLGQVLFMADNEGDESLESYKGFIPNNNKSTFLLL